MQLSRVCSSFCRVLAGKLPLESQLPDFNLELALCGLFLQDVTSLADYYKANLALTSSDSPFTPAHLSSFMRAQPKMLPPSVFSKSEVSSSLVGPGCYVSSGCCRPPLFLARLRS